MVLNAPRFTSSPPRIHRQNTIKKTSENPTLPCIDAVSTTLTNTREYSPPQSSDSPSAAAATSATAPADYAAHSPTSAAPPAPAAAPQSFARGSSAQAPGCTPSAD